MMQQKDEKKKKAAIKLIKYIMFGGLGCLAWTLTMLLNIIIAIDHEAGIAMFIKINSYLYMLYATLVGIGVFIYLIEYIFNKKPERFKEAVFEDITDYRKK